MFSLISMAVHDRTGGSRSLREPRQRRLMSLRVSLLTLVSSEAYRTIGESPIDLLVTNYEDARICKKKQYVCIY